MRESYPSYPIAIRQAIDRGGLIRGMTHEQVFLALGEPLCKKTIQPNEKPIEVWHYPPGGRDPCLHADTRVYFEDGVVSGWK
jgi:outer membrane protein assembly factor BamE